MMIMNKKRVILASVFAVLMGIMGVVPCMAKTYTMQKGDTLWDLSTKYYGDPTLYPIFLEVNAITNPRTIPTGKVIVVPSMDEIKGISKEHDPAKRADLISKITGATAPTSSGSSSSSDNPFSKPLLGGSSGTGSGGNSVQMSSGGGMTLQGVLEGPKVKSGKLKHAENVKRQ